MSVIFSHHSAEYLPPIMSSPLRVNCTRYMHNRGDIMYMMYMLRMYMMYIEGGGKGLPPEPSASFSGKSPDLPSA